VGFSSFGQTVYETEYNSGIGSNGLTSARHDVLSKFYAEKFKESYENSLASEVVYIGPYLLTDTVGREQYQVGKLLLSPTRTYAPLLQAMFANHFDAIHGLIHCSGGGQTKCMKYLPGNFRVIKDNLFEPPIIFQLIQEASGSDNREMYQVFNMGHRLEVFTDAASAPKFIEEAQKLGIEAQIVGRVEASDKKELVLKVGNEEIVY
jgi:phosphoribosylformylglycinamidine cyclo-ligase